MGGSRLAAIAWGVSAAAVSLFAIPEVTAQIISEDVITADGVHLATDVYLPLSFGAVPTVLIRTTYDKDDLAPLCLGVNVMGYACAAQDTRGRFASGGADTVFRDDGDDGRTTIDWVTRQWWSDGSVCMMGASALAITSYLATPAAPSGLRCVLAAVATPDLYHHAFLQGGALRESLVVNWLEEQNALDFLSEVRDHRLWDGWWQEVDVVSRVAEVEVPGLHIGGWYDIFLQGTLDAYSSYQHAGGEGARGNQSLVVGPWTHGSAPGNTAGELVYPANAEYDILSAAESWFDRWLDGKEHALDSWPPVRIYLMGAVGEADAPGNTWIGFHDWPPPARDSEIFLSAEGGLGRARPSPDQLELLIDPDDPVPTLGGANLKPDQIVDGRPMGSGPHDQRPVEVRADVLVFSSEPLAAPLTIIGPVRARLWIIPDTPDLDLSVRLSDVYPDGRSMLVTDGIQRARMRCGGDRECLLDVGAPTTIEVDLWSTAMVFNAGHRIRVAIAGSNWPRFEVNPNDGGDLDSGTPIVARPTILFGGSTPSSLHLPIVEGPRRADGRRPADHIPRVAATPDQARHTILEVFGADSRQPE